MEVEFPTPYAGEHGLQTSRGNASFRALQSLYQAWRIAQIAAGKKPFRVLEIGAGLGRTAYFASKLGIDDYTPIDIPLAGAAQAYFLGRTLGSNNVCLHGEDDPGSVNIIPASSLPDLRHDFDLVVNVDSMTEMDPNTMAAYWKFVSECHSKFLSINHDENGRSVADLYQRSPGLTVARHPYWMRRGYTEELVTFI